jgi:hypothetical protein
LFSDTPCGEVRPPAARPIADIDHFVDLGDLRVRLAPFYSSMGRPSIDPELFAHLKRILLLGARAWTTLLEGDPAPQ